MKQHNNIILNLSAAQLAEKGAEHTAPEIVQQPAMWLETCKMLHEQCDAIREFLSLARKPNTKIVFTGAGTSEFVGNTVVPYLRSLGQQNLYSIGTTDLVATPEAYLHPNDEVLLVSCARSGNSPESVAAAKLVEDFVQSCHHLLLSCNSQGALAQQFGTKKNAYVVKLGWANDQGFAMTGSFTGMLISAALIFQLDQLANFEPALKYLSHAMEEFFLNLSSVIDKLLAQNKSRIICLGSAENKGIAQEAHLKMLELSASYNTANFDSPMGFRHGPKSLLNDESIVFFFPSPKPYTHLYDIDMLRELMETTGNHYVVAVSPQPLDEGLCHQEIRLPALSTSQKGQGKIEEGPLRILYSLVQIVTAQIYALANSLSLGVRPDNPSPSGSVNRVVQGVRIYKYSDSLTIHN